MSTPTTRTHTLIAAHLVRLGACEEEVRRFRRRYPKGLRLRGAMPRRVPPAWIEWAETLLSPPALAEYDRVKAAAWAEYERVKAPALWSLLCRDGIQDRP